MDLAMEDTEDTEAHGVAIGEVLEVDTVDMVLWDNLAIKVLDHLNTILKALISQINLIKLQMEISKL